MSHLIPSMLIIPLPQKAVTSISTPAEAIIETTAGRREYNIPCSVSKFRYFKYSFARIVTIMHDGRMQPSVATTAPGIPAIFIPTKVAELTAIGPGVICEMVIIDHLSLDQWHGCIPASKAEHSYLNKAPKQL